MAYATGYAMSRQITDAATAYTRLRMMTLRYVGVKMPTTLSSVLPKRGLPSASVVPKLSAMSSSSAEMKNTDIQTVPGTSIQVHSRSLRARRGGACATTGSAGATSVGADSM